MPVTVAVLGVGAAVLVAIFALSRCSEQTASSCAEDVEPANEEVAVVRAASRRVGRSFGS